MKNDRGYILVYAVVVLTVVGLLVTAMLSAGLHELQAQHRMVEAMVSRYAAEGEIERQIAELVGTAVDGSKVVDGKFTIELPQEVTDPKVKATVEFVVDDENNLTGEYSFITYTVE